MQKNINKFIEYNIIISFLNKKRYKNKEKTKEIVHLIQDMEKKFINVHLELNSTFSLVIIVFLLKVLTMCVISSIIIFVNFISRGGAVGSSSGS